MVRDVARPRLAGCRRVRVRHADGSWLAIEAVAKNLLNDLAVGGVVVNIARHWPQVLEDELKRQAFHDSLTGLANRALFADRLGAAIPAERADRLAVLFIDLDDSRPSTTAWATARGISR